MFADKWLIEWGVIIFVEMMTTKHWSLNHDYQQSNSDKLFTLSIYTIFICITITS